MVRAALALFICLMLVAVPLAQTPSPSSAQAGELDEARELSLRVVKLYQAGKLDEALPLAKRALELREKILGKEDQLVIESLLNLAELKFAKNFYRDSLALFERVLKNNVKQAGPDDASNVVLLDKIALLRYLTGDFVGAENFYRRSLAVNEKSFDPESEPVAKAAFNLAEFYRFTAQYQKAEPLYRRALFIRDRKLAADDPLRLRTLEHFRCVFYQSDRPDKLKALDEELGARREAQNPVPSLEVVNERVLSLPRPEYPAQARRARVTGIIVIKATIDESGHVVSAENMCGGNGTLSRAATEAASRARFGQTLLAGQPVKVTGLIIYRFTL